MVWVIDHIEDAHKIVGKPVYNGEISVDVERVVPNEDPNIRMPLRNRLYEEWFNASLIRSVDGAGLWDISGVWYTGDKHLVLWDDAPGACYDSATCAEVKSFSVSMEGKRQANTPSAD
jgi:hypothetical protein